MTVEILEIARELAESDPTEWVLDHVTDAGYREWVLDHFTDAGHPFRVARCFHCHVEGRTRTVNVRGREVTEYGPLTDPGVHAASCIWLRARNVCRYAGVTVR